MDDIRFRDEDWTRLKHDWLRWWEHDLERPIVVLATWDPGPPMTSSWGGWLASAPREVTATEIVEHWHAGLCRMHYHGDAFPEWWPNFGPGIAAGFLGGMVNPVPDTTWFGPGSFQGLPIADLHPAYDPDNWWWRRVQDVTRAAVARWRGKVCVGFTDIGGGLDILASLRESNQLLLDCLDEPEEVARLAGEITRVWLRYYRELHAILKTNGACGTRPWAPVWSPTTTYMLQCDFCYMISPRMFERFVLPDLAACCEAIDHPFYHLDGKGELPHVDHLLSLKKLRGIQWIPGSGQPPASEWPQLLRRIRDGGKLIQVFVSPQEALTIAHEVGGKGMDFCVSGDGMSHTDAADFVKKLVRECRDAG